MTRPLTIAICVGEASGDLLGAHLIRAIKTRRPDAEFVGIGGERMKAEGFHSLYDQEKLAVRGFVEVVRRLPEILKIRKGIIRDLTALRPDVFVGIDAPDFNLGVAEKLKKAGIPTIHYVSPSVWAWRPERVNTIVHQVNRVLCLFPMEPQLYINAGGKAEFVGHPMAQTMPLEDDKTAARAKLGINPPSALFAILPGSQIREVDSMAPVFLQTALLLLKRYPDAQFILPTATEATRQRIGEILARPEFAKLPLTLVHKQADTVCTAADVVMVTSGTATLEVALCKRPMVISYKISALTYAYVKRKVNVQHVGLPNILLEKSAVPELLQHDAVPEKLAAAVADWYDHPEKIAAVQQDFRQLHLLLKKDTAALAAQAVLEEAKAV
ncbi:lipid-A-disaccharide synthase [Neisseria animalis]|uniref:Lipid-A-disaccharide synthase n=1 Tax=Neisseria animalis TaxID=492 RepID=A0A5P3MTL1_NEIAN|nr:lipid-A-disaccharide synthase [Neisseria animalis]QEY24962.1 lipid-A-disaccharide synthase [Neisseria animalis]ROW32924.1 lipid-A-disaccharide synthase [Neisseria animalis]VEE09643.1 lipid-A-disaccharide synthase [Neisseria animalis]